MRRRLVLAVLALSLPAAEVAAQRIRLPRIGSGATPERPAEKPPQAPGITDALAYSRYKLGRFSFENYPMLTYLQTTGFVGEGIPTNYTMLGDGFRVGFRITPSLSLSTDMTSAALGGPFAFGTTDLGLRLKPWTGLRFTPIIDARASWAMTIPVTSGYLPASVLPGLIMARSMYDMDITTGSGRGTILGIGGETRIRPWLTMTTTLSTTRYRMTSREVGGSWREWKYTADATRFAVGLRYNTGSWMEPR
jgi:hypothetical protein